MRAARFGVYSRMPSADSTDLPRIRSTTSRAFCAVMRENLLDARASIATSSLLARRLGRVRSTRPRPFPCGRRNGRGRCASARPGLDDALLAGLDHGSYLLHQMEVHEGTFFHRPCHAGVLPSGLVDSSRYFALRRWRMNLLVRLLCLVLYPLVGFPQGVCGWLPFERPSPPPCG